jgi:hypothetical protein
VSSASLLLSAVQLDVALKGSALRANASSLPARYTEEELKKIAATVTEPYNRDDVDAIYKSLDDVVKNQLTRQKVADTVQKLKGMLGTVDSLTYEGFKELPHENSLPVYQLNYSVKLSGAQLPVGTMQINVLDRPSGPSLVGFFIFARTQ